MSEDWSDWIEHDGKGCPVVGQYVHAIFDAGTPRDLFGMATGAACWFWDAPRKPYSYGKVTRYRIRRPRALEHLRQIARDVEHLTPTAGSLEIAQFTRERMK